ncbi:MAG: elongation factor G [Planctomycetes bacterium]|nr:elongation factor G [Planctomycetota bacterium]
MNARTHVEDVRNIALVGHGAVGKTTLADLMLFKAGAVSRPGSVDDGSSVLDFDDEEKQHKYTISSSFGYFTFAGCAFTVVDTPGYPDFIGQTIGALRGVETAVIVISAVAGIEVNTRKVFTLAGEEHLGRIVVINKLDLENIRFPELIASIQETFGKKCVLMNVPNGLGTSFTGVTSTLHVPDSPPAGMPIHPAEVTQSLMDAIVDADENLMARYLEGDTFTDEEIAHGIEHAIALGTLIPIFCLSARSGVGVPEFMAAVAEDGLTAADIPHKVRNAAGEELPLVESEDAPLVAQVFKTRIDPFVSRMSYIRIFSGKLAKESTVLSARSGKSLKITNLFRVQGGQTLPIERASAGDIVALIKMEDLQVGDTLTDGKAGVLTLPPLNFPTPMIGLAVEPKSRNDQTKISGALHKIAEEDQTFHTEREAQTHEMVMRGMSDLHLKIIEERLHRRDKVDVLTHPPKIPYRETVAGAHEGMYRHKKQSGGAGQFGEVHLRVSHLPQGLNIEEYCTKDRFENLRRYHYHPEFNYVFVDRVSGGSVPNQFIPAVEKGILERIEKGVVAGFHVQDVCVELFFGKDHPVDSNENAFRTAGSHCFKQEFALAKPVLLEPIMKVEITVPGDKLGDISSDLNGRRGRVEGMDSAPGGFQLIVAKVPLSEVSTYARNLSSMTGGRGSFTMEFSHYEAVPAHEQAKIVAAAVHHKEEDE